MKNPSKQRGTFILELNLNRKWGCLEGCLSQSVASGYVTRNSYNNLFLIIISDINAMAFALSINAIRIRIEWKREG